jgi:hypothetical protein
VYRPVVAGSVEEEVFNTASAKLGVATAVKVTASSDGDGGDGPEVDDGDADAFATAEGLRAAASDPAAGSSVENGPLAAAAAAKAALAAQMLAHGYWGAALQLSQAAGATAAAAPASGGSGDHGSGSGGDPEVPESMRQASALLAADPSVKAIVVKLVASQTLTAEERRELDGAQRRLLQAAEEQAKAAAAARAGDGDGEDAASGMRATRSGLAGRYTALAPTALRKPGVSMGGRGRRGTEGTAEEDERPSVDEFGLSGEDDATEITDDDGDSGGSRGGVELAAVAAAGPAPPPLLTRLTLPQARRLYRAVLMFGCGPTLER